MIRSPCFSAKESPASLKSIPGAAHPLLTSVVMMHMHDTHPCMQTKQTYTWNKKQRVLIDVRNKSDRIPRIFWWRLARQHYFSLTSTCAPDWSSLHSWNGSFNTADVHYWVSIPQTRTHRHFNFVQAHACFERILRILDWCERAHIGEQFCIYDSLEDFTFIDFKTAFHYRKLLSRLPQTSVLSGLFLCLLY